MSDYEIRCACESPADKVLMTKVKGLDEKLSKAELLQALLHACNHRGYKDFYEVTETDEAESQEEEDEKINQTAADRLDRSFEESHCRTISEYICRYCTIPGIDDRLSQSILKIESHDPSKETCGKRGLHDPEEAEGMVS